MTNTAVKPVCSNCGKTPPKLMKCSACKDNRNCVRYCDRKCQKKTLQATQGDRRLACVTKLQAVDGDGCDEYAASAPTTPLADNLVSERRPRHRAPNEYATKATSTTKDSSTTAATRMRSIPTSAGTAAHNRCYGLNEMIGNAASTRWPTRQGRRTRRGLLLSMGNFDADDDRRRLREGQDHGRDEGHAGGVGRMTSACEAPCGDQELRAAARSTPANDGVDTALRRVTWRRRQRRRQRRRARRLSGHVDSLNPCKHCADADADGWVRLRGGTGDFGPLADNDPNDVQVPTPTRTALRRRRRRRDNDGILDGPDTDALDPNVCRTTTATAADDCQGVGVDGVRARWR